MFLVRVIDMVYADLHVHTTASDGLLSLDEIIQEAKRKDISVVGITDHDTINHGLVEREETIDGVGVVTGTEVKTEHMGTRIEILCYFVDPEDNELEEIFENMRRRRIERMKKMVERFNELEETVLRLREVEELADGPVGRPHFAMAVANKGLAKDTREAFDNYAKEHTPYYVPLERPDVKKVIRRAKRSGAFTSLAHPCTEDIEDFETFLESLAELGLDGCEVNYPYRESPKDMELDPKKVEETVEKVGLVKTGGSDFHDRKDFTLGSGGVGKKTLEKMRNSVEL